jgi:translation elongation factor EF-G
VGRLELGEKSERIGQLYLFTPGKRLSVPEAHPGDIVGLAKLKALSAMSALSDYTADDFDVWQTARGL